MGSATETMVKASVQALEFREAAWDAEERGRRCPDASELSDPTLLTILRYESSDLPADASEAVQAEAKDRGLITGHIDRFLPWAVLASLVSSGMVIVLELLMG